MVKPIASLACEHGDSIPDWVLHGHPEVQETITRHHAWIENFYPASAEVYSGLGQLYVEHPEFRAYYEAYAPNLADFMQAAMNYYAEHTLGG